MKKIYRTIRKYTQVVAVILLIILLLLTTKYFIHSIKIYYNEGELHPHYKSVRSSVYNETKDQKLAQLASWMTFDYINVVFGIPPDYLKTNLNITDPGYPNIRIDRYAKHNGI